MATMKLQEMAAWMAGAAGDASEGDRAHYLLLLSDIGRFLDRPYEPGVAPGAPAAPPGSPIGDSGLDWAGSGWALMPLGGGAMLDLTCSWGLG